VSVAQQVALFQIAQHMVVYRRQSPGRPQVSRRQQVMCRT
jgi:hypothetical protein